MAEAKADLQSYRQQRAHEDQLRDLEREEQRRRTLRLEDIIEACVEHMWNNGGVPYSLQKTIKREAPGALSPMEGGNQTAANHQMNSASMANGGPSNTHTQALTAMPNQYIPDSTYGNTATHMMTDEIQERWKGLHPWYNEQYVADNFTGYLMTDDQNMM